MSIVALSWVLRHSEAKLGPRLTLLALAEFAHDDGSRAFPTVETLQERTRMSRRGVQDALRRLEADGMIVQTGTTKYGAKVWRVVMERAAEGGADSAGSASSSAPNPSIDPSGDPPASEEAGSHTREHDEFGEWIGHHSEVTGMGVLRAGTKARAHVATMFAARRSEGYDLPDLKLATVGAFNDANRRQGGWFDPESVLRPTKVAKLIEAGRRHASGRDWTAFDAD